MHRNRMTNIGVPIMQITRKSDQLIFDHQLQKVEMPDLRGTWKTSRLRKSRKTAMVAQRKGHRGKPERTNQQQY